MTRKRVHISKTFSMQGYDRLGEVDFVEVPEDELNPAGPTVLREVEKEVYRVSPELEEVINLALALGRPLLLQGEPGCGKTRLAYALAYALSYPLEVSYIKSTSRAQDLLYTYDGVRRLYEAQLHREAPKTDSDPLEARQSGSDPLEARKSGSDPLEVRKYIRLGPLGRAIARAQHGRRSVVLIDEIDKGDLDFPNDLLWELDRLEFQVAEEPSIAFKADPAARPVVVITHNEEKALPAAFLRRCIFHYIKFPEQPEELLSIVAMHQLADEALSGRAIEVIRELRGLGLTRRPGLSELLDWVGYAAEMKTPIEALEEVPHRGALIKDQDDQQRVEAYLEGQRAEARKREQAAGGDDGAAMKGAASGTNATEAGET